MQAAVEGQKGAAAAAESGKAGVKEAKRQRESEKVSSITAPVLIDGGPHVKFCFSSQNAESERMFSKEGQFSDSA